MDFVWTLLDFSMELTRVCVELVWRLCFGVELVWILNFGFIPTFGVILGLIVGWFYAVFLACFVLCFWHVLCCVCGMFCGLNWEDIVAGGQGLFRYGFGSKLACTGAAKELSGTQLCGTHAIAWLGSKFLPSSTQLRGFPRNCVAPAHFQASNFGRP